MPRPIRAVYRRSLRCAATSRLRARHAPRSQRLRSHQGERLRSRARARGARARRCRRASRCVELDEAVRLREAGTSQADPAARRCLRAARARRSWASTASRPSCTASSRSRCSRPPGCRQRVLDVLLKMNTGMNRLGFAPPSATAQALARLARSRRRAGITLMTHFANADTSRGIAEQLAAVRGSGRTDPRASRASPTPPPMLRYPEAHADWVRPGIMLYGCSPFRRRASAAALGLQPGDDARERAHRGARRSRAASRVGYGGSSSPTGAHAHRRGRLRLRRRLSAPCADRHAGARGW